MKKFMLVLAVALAATAVFAEPIVKSGDKIAFLGDSITQFGNQPVGYVNLVMEGLKCAGVTNCVKIAAGVSGDKSNQMLARLQRDVLAKMPTWVTVSCGVNDVAHGAKGVPLGEYEKNITAIFDQCDAAKAKVIVMTATLIGEDVSNSNNVKAVAYNGFLRTEAKRRGYVLADANEAMRAALAKFPASDTRKNKLTKDGVHMSFAGDCMMAYCLLDAMGVDPALHETMRTNWRRLPKAFMTGVGLSVEDKEKVDAFMKAGGYTSLQEYVHDMLLEIKRN